ncbi:MAG: polymorphic toxin-type HINT domain-containing protein [Saprospiraceae bacterium]|nr:polymorphic toxin-type HINT domain-containing protein [Saprospiraceae bacterium]
MHTKFRNISFTNAATSMAVTAGILLSPSVMAVPIQDVQLLDYAVAHTTVNAGYGLTANADSDRSIENDIYLGLLDKDPYTSDQQRARDEYEINDIDWNEVVFEEFEADVESEESESIIKMALHSEWIQQKGYHVDAIVQLHLPEQNIHGPFRITSIKHIIPQKRPSAADEEESELGDNYTFKPVTALFSHISDAICTLEFDHGESIGVTYPHPIYSVTQGDWKAAGELTIGEDVLTQTGTATVVRNTKKEGRERVYNLEVKDLHNFLVGERGMVVHNAYKKEDVKNWMDDAEFLERLPKSNPARSAIAELKKMKADDVDLFDQFMDDFEFIPLELGEGGVKAWKIAKKAGSSLAKNIDALAKIDFLKGKGFSNANLSLLVKVDDIKVLSFADGFATRNIDEAIIMEHHFKMMKIKAFSSLDEFSKFQDDINSLISLQKPNGEYLLENAEGVLNKVKSMNIDGGNPFEIGGHDFEIEWALSMAKKDEKVLLDAPNSPDVLTSTGPAPSGYQCKKVNSTNINKTGGLAIEAVKQIKPNGDEAPPIGYLRKIVIKIYNQDNAVINYTEEQLETYFRNYNKDGPANFQGYWVQGQLNGLDEFLIINNNGLNKISGNKIDL